MSKYPNTAELAAFRQSIRPYDGGWAPIRATGAAGAWTDEIRRGIGSQTGNAYGMQQAWSARREANRLRSRWASEGRWGVEDMYTFSGQRYQDISAAQDMFAGGTK